MTIAETIKVFSIALLCGAAPSCNSSGMTVSYRVAVTDPSAKAISITIEIDGATSDTLTLRAFEEDSVIRVRELAASDADGRAIPITSETFRTMADDEHRLTARVVVTEGYRSPIQIR